MRAQRRQDYFGQRTYESVVRVRAQQIGAADLAPGQDARLDQAGDLVGHGSQRNTEPARQVGDGLLAVGVQENRSENFALRSGPEHREQSRRAATHNPMISPIYA